MTNLNLEETITTVRLQQRSKRCQIRNPELYLLTAGGKIKCRRCVGVSSRTKKQCGHVALKTSKASRCKWHAGASTGPSTQEGIEAIRKANTTFGNFTKEAIAKRRGKFAELNGLAVTLGINLRGRSKPI